MDLSRAPIRNMEPAIVERLRLAFPRSSFTIERVPQTMTITEFQRLAKLAPFIGIAWVGFDADKDNQRAVQGYMLWSLILIVKASNGLEARFKGDAFQIGLDAMVDVATMLLQGAQIPDVGPCTVTGARSLIAEGWSDDAIAIAQIDFKVRFTNQLASLKLSTPADFAALGITWDLGGETVSETLNQTEE